MAWSKASVARWHRWMGLWLSIPLLAWLASAFAMHQIVHDAPNGLQGVYDLAPVSAGALPLDSARVSPDSILSLLAEDGVEHIYAIRLESHGPLLHYVVRTTPYAIARTYDAFTGVRMDPLPDDRILAIASAHLEGTEAERLVADVREYHRDYTAADVPSARVQLAGVQPSELILSRASGRPMRRLDGIATGFEAWYRALHVFQWGGAMGVFTTILYVVTAAVLVLAVLGLVLWFWRRGKRRPSALTWHGRAGITAGVFLIVEILVGAYMWLSLGPMQDPFRGKNTFAVPEQGIATTAGLASPGDVLVAASRDLEGDPGAVPLIEWRRIDDRPVWIVRMARNEIGTTFDAQTAAVWEPPVDAVGRSVQALMRGHPSFAIEQPRTYYWNDLNRAIPVYHYRFADGTDVYASRTTSEIVSRRTGFWRAFSPFLMVHTVAFSGDDTTNAVFLLTMLVAITLLVLTGWWAWWVTRSRRRAAQPG